jgi:hypothetical protein
MAGACSACLMSGLDAAARDPTRTESPLPDDASVDVVLTRVFNAPRDLVYQAFTDPDQLARWYGPVGFSVPRDSVEVDARVGGHLRLVLREGPHPAGMAEGGRQAWEAMFTKLDTLLEGLSRPA